MSWHYRVAYLLVVALLSGACGATVQQVIPTERPTITPTLTRTPTRTPDGNVTPTATSSPLPMTTTGGPSPTALFGATGTRAASEPTSTPVSNPNAPRIEFFTSDSVAVAPGDRVTLFWSARGGSAAAIYRLDETGARNQVWNVQPDGSLTVQTRRSDRGQIDFVLSVSNGPFITEQPLSLPLACAEPWFFVPPPPGCPDSPALTTMVIEQPFERGRMLYIQQTNRVYALFNDNVEPAWALFSNRYDPSIHPELEARFQPPPGRVQPLRILGLVWRGNDRVRSRLGLGLDQEFEFEGFVQTSTATDGSESLYVSSADGTVLQLLPRGAAWQIITPR